MSQYNKTVLTNAGLELAKRANAGQAKFEITRAVTSADDWSNKTIQDLEEATAIPNIMQQGTIMDAEEVESNNSVIGVSLCFTNKDLSTSYQIKIIGLYVKEEGQDKDFLYAVTTAVSPEYMPDFNDKVMYRFNMQIYLVIGKAQAVNVVINDGASVTHGQFDKYKAEVTGNLKKLENTHKEDMSHVAKSASINGGAEILPDSTGKLNLVVPDPDLSKYVSLEQLGELLKAKADITAVPDKTDTEEGIKQAKAAAKAADDKAQSALVQLPNKADISTVNAQIADVKDTAQSNLNKVKSDLNGAINTKANSSDLTALDKKAVKSVGIYPNNLHFDSGSFNYWSGEVKASPDTNGYALIDLTDDTSVQAAANQLNAMLTGLNHLQGTVNGKADKTDVASLQNTVNNIDSTRTPIVAGNSGDDLFSFKTNQIRLYNGNGSACKHLPPARNTNWFSVQYVFEGPNDNGIAIYRTPYNETWTVGCNGGSYTTPFSLGWLRVANSNDISSLQNQISTKANASDVSNPNLLYGNPIRSDMVSPINGDSKHFDYYGIVNWDFVAYPLSSFKKGNTFTFSGTVNITGKQATGKYRIAIYNKNLTHNYMNDYDLNSGKYDSVTFTVNADSEEQDPHYLLIYSGEPGKTMGNSMNANYVKLEKGTVATPWCPPNADYATSNDINSLQSTINQQNQTIQSLTTRLNNAENEIKYIKDNYIEGKRFPASQEAQANSWENEKPTRLAMIEK